ncbi:ribonuclease H2, subunit B [Umbelopsis sp. PMI_123]|nr:ribonuclease H2, subunit B [Umbelopsis sp. PMI_123]
MSTQWIGIRPKEPEHAGASVSIQVPHPRTGEPSRYVLQQNGVMLEVQKVEAEHKQSWLIGNSVQKNGILYMMTPIDPLFLLLPVLASLRKKSAESHGRYVQYDSIFSDADDDQRYQSLHHLAVIPRLSEQLGHLCDQQEYIKGEYAYRLNEDKALKWLQLKVQVVADNIEKMPVLLQFINEQLFGIDAPQMDTNIRNDAYTWAGIQVVSEYVTEAWQETLSKSYRLTNLEKQVEEHKKKQAMQYENYVTHDPTEFAKAKREASDLSDQGSKKPKLSAGQKTLAKANIKGMKSLTAFFAKK